MIVISPSICAMSPTKTSSAAGKRYQADHKIAATGVVLENMWSRLAAGTR